MADEDHVANYLKTNWREAARASREAMEALRRIVPEMASQLDEIDEKHLCNGLIESEKALALIEQAGKGVLGQDDYRTYLETKIERKMADGSSR